MEFNEDDLIRQIDRYFDNTSEEQFLKDLKETDSLDLVEDVKDDEQLWHDLFRDMLNTQHHREWEYRLFKKSVQQFVDKQTYKSITDNYSQRVTHYRNKTQD